MTRNETEILTALQALAIAAHQQTGIPTAYSSFTTEQDGRLHLHASVTIMPDSGPWSMNGTNSPYPAGGEMTLPELRDEVGKWIVANRKEAA